MKRYAQHYVCKNIEGKWRITLYTFDTRRSSSAYIGKTWINTFYTYDLALRFLNEKLDTLKAEFGESDEIGLAKTSKTICLYHYYD